MTTDELLDLCNKHPFLEEMTKKFWINRAAEYNLEVQGKEEGYIDAMDCYMRLTLGSSNASIRHNILKLFKPFKLGFN